jgi:hypothetical protein
MSATPVTDSRNLDVFGIMSTTTGGIGIALTLWGQLLRAERYAFHVNNGHGMTDDIMLLTLVPGFICAVLAIVLGTAGLRDRTSGRAWAIVGLVVGTIAVALTVSGIPVDLVPNPRIQPEIP